MTLPADATKVHMDAAADDPKQARAELADLVDKFNALIDHLQLSVITNDPLAIGQGIESDGAGNLRVKLDGATIARSASGIKVADTQLTTAKFANITANRVIGSSGAGVVGEVSASEGVQIASSVAKLDINGLTAETTIDTTSDYVAMYDASATAHRKVLVGIVGGNQLLSTLTASASASLDFTTEISSTFDEYELHLEDIVCATTTAGTYLAIEVYVGGAWKTSGYRSVCAFIVAAGQGYHEPTARIALTDATYARDTPISARIIFTNPNSTAQTCRFWGQSAYKYSPGPNAVLGNISGFYDTAGAAVTQIRLIASAGNLTSGKARLYGVRK